MPVNNPRPPVKLDPNIRYRVRDRDWSALWGEDLVLPEAERLKRFVAGKRWSTTVCLEDTTAEVPAELRETADWAREHIGTRPPDRPRAVKATPAPKPTPAAGPDPQLAAMQARSLAAARQSAAVAQKRADQQAQKKLDLEKAEALRKEAEERIAAAGNVDEEAVDMDDSEFEDLVNGGGGVDVEDEAFARAQKAADEDAKRGVTLESVREQAKIENEKLD